MGSGIHVSANTFVNIEKTPSTNIILLVGFNKQRADQFEWPPIQGSVEACLVCQELTIQGCVEACMFHQELNEGSVHHENPFVGPIL